MAGQIWSESNLRPDPTNESYYWAVVSERMKGEEGLLGLDSDYEAAEGKPHLVQHLRRERDRTLAKKKKQAVLKLMGRLACEACGFDFAVRYLDLGRNFCEVHHRTLLAKGPTINNLDDLAILCSNCHRMIHLTEPMESVDTFRRRFSQAAVI
jgi:5-methylcytosine-specific restriction protein A